MKLFTEKKIRHLALIMDGNRRWAKREGRFSFEGHRQGLESVKIASNFCLDRGIEYLSLYTFSLENFRRSDEEKSYLFSLLLNALEKHIADYKEKQVRIKFIGDRSLFPEKLHAAIETAEKETVSNTRLQINVLFCYGGRQEIIGGVKTLLHKLKQGEIAEADISDDIFEQCLWTNGIPEPDLIIRTGGAHRLSNFLLYQAAYAELYFLDCFWPELTQDHLIEAVGSFEKSQRNLGV